MNLNKEIYQRFLNTEWFCNCGSGPAEFAGKIPGLWLTNVEEAILSATSTEWMDAGTEAQGDLTGYLAKKHYNSYGGHWNRLAKESGSVLDLQVVPKVEKALTTSLLPMSLLPRIKLDLNRIALFFAYNKQIKNIPDFFGQLASLYEAGYFPCGWKGDFDKWPTGQLVIF